MPRRFVSTIVFQSSHVTSTAGLRMLQPALFIKDVDVAELADGLVDGTANARFLADIELDAHDAAAERFDLFGSCFERIERAAGNGDVGAGTGQGAGELLAEAAAGAGYEGGFAGKVEGVGHVGFESSGMTNDQAPMTNKKLAIRSLVLGIGHF